MIMLRKKIIPDIMMNNQDIRNQNLIGKINGTIIKNLKVKRLSEIAMKTWLSINGWKQNGNGNPF